MKVKFLDLAGYCRAIRVEDTSFAFYSKEYSFPAAELFSAYLSSLTKTPDFFYSSIQEAQDGEIALYGSCTDSDIPGIVKVIEDPVDAPRIFAFLEGELSSKASVNALAGICVLVDVEELTESTVADAVRYVCALKKVAFDELAVQWVCANGSAGWGSLITLIDLSVKKYGSLKADPSLSYNDSRTISYKSLEDTIIYGSKADAASAMLGTYDMCLGYVTQLVNTLAVYHSLLVTDEAGTKTIEVSTIFGMDVNLLRNKLLPRLRVMGRGRLLHLIDKLSEAQSKVLEGIAIPSIPLHMAATIMLAM